MNTLPIDTIRQNFPILDENVYGRPLVYLDNGATTQKPLQVLDAVRQVYEHQNANIHRGVHHLSNVCTELYEKARQTVSKHIGASRPEEIVFTRNTTEAINLVAFAYGDTFVGKDDEVIVSQMEHHSNIVPWQLLCQRRGAKLRVIDVTEQGELDIDSFLRLLSAKTRIVSIAHISNVLGTVNDVRQICRLAHEVGAVVLVDAAQSIAHKSIDVAELGCDFLAFSGHKVYAPLGSGALYGRYELLEQMSPWMGGGEMIDKVTFEKTTFANPPLRFEAGTPDYVGAVGLAAAIDFIDAVGMQQIELHEQVLVNRCIDGLRSMGGVRLIGTAANHSGAVSFLVGKAHPYDVGMILDKMGVAVRTGHHCAQPLVDRFGIPGTVRASFGVYNTVAEVDVLLGAVERAKMMLG